MLRDANGAIVERLAGRQNDWNIAMSRRLPAGRYALTLSAMKADFSATRRPNDPTISTRARTRATTASKCVSRCPPKRTRPR